MSDPTDSYNARHEEDVAQQKQFAARDPLFQQISPIDATSTGDDIRDVLYQIAYRIVELDQKHTRLLAALRNPQTVEYSGAEEIPETSI